MKKYIYTTCSKCGAEKVADNQGYCVECKREYNKQYDEEMQGHYLYMIMNGDTIQYIGKTNRIDRRISNHINGHSPNTKHIFEFGKWTEIKFLDVTDLVDDDVELRVLENDLINLYKPSCNVVTSTNYLLHNSRLFELITAIHGREWEAYKINLHKKNSLVIGSNKAR